MASKTNLQPAIDASNVLERLAGSDRRKVAGALVALAGLLLEQDVATDETTIDLVAEGQRRGIFPSSAVGGAHCREGRVPGAAKVGRRWVGPASALDAFVREHGAAPARRVEATKAEGADPLLEATRAAARRGRR